MKRFVSIAVAAGIALTASTAPSMAAVEEISGSLNSGGHIVQFKKERIKHGTGDVTVYLGDITSGSTRLGLRRSDNGKQFTRTLEWEDTGQKAWTDVLDRTRFKMNGRMTPCKFIVCDRDFSGNINY